MHATLRGGGCGGMFYIVHSPVLFSSTKTALLSLLLVALALTAGGCVFMNDEDRDFYGKGWVKPNDLDKPVPHHTIPDPSHPEQQAPAQTASTDATPWLIPEQGQQ